MTKKLENALEQQKQQTEQSVPFISGLLGIPLSGQKRVEVPGRNSYVFVRLRSNQSEVVQAFNNKVSTSYGLPVLVERQGNRYVIIDVDTKRYDNNWNSQSAFLPRHGNTHSFDLETGGGADTVWVYPRQIVPILVMPSGSVGGPNVIVNPYTLKKDDGNWRYVGNTGTSNLTQHNPTSPTGAIMALVYLNADTGNPQFSINSGTVFSNSITGSSQIIPYIPRVESLSYIPLAAIRLVTGTEVISWDNIYDVRQFLHTISTGSGGGVSSFLGLSDTPNSYAGKSGSVVRVNYAENGLEFPQALNEILLTNIDDSPPPGSASKLHINQDDLLVHTDSFYGAKHFLSFGTMDNWYQNLITLGFGETGTVLVDSSFPIQSVVIYDYNDGWVKLPVSGFNNHPFIIHNNNTGSVVHVYDELGNSDTLIPGQSGWFVSRRNEGNTFRYVTMLKNTAT